MQFHRVRLIGQNDLPRGHDWALVEHDGRITLFITEEALTPRKLEETWAAIRLLTAPRHPRPRLIEPPQPRHANPLLNSA
jgi:hypothetical protein